MRVNFFKYCLLIIVLTACSAVAKECAPPPPPKERCPVYPCCWTGAYVGVHGGYSWSSCDVRFTPLPNAATFVNLRPLSVGVDPGGAFGGAQMGYNLQWRCFVLGVEADIAGGELSGKEKRTPIIQNNGTPFLGKGFIEARQLTNWFGTFRPRFGLRIARCYLLYVTGGLAYGRTRFRANTDFRPIGTTQYPVSFSKVQTGWTAGLGLEYLFCKNWSIRGEYLYYNLGTIARTAHAQPLAPPFQVRYRFETNNNLFYIGLNRRFGCCRT